MSPPDDPDDDEDTDRRRPTEHEQRRHAKSYPFGMPILPELDPAGPEDAEDIGSPYDTPIIPTRRDAEAVRRASRDPDDPVRAIDISAMFRGFGKLLIEHIHRKYEKSLDALDRLRFVVEGTRDEPGLVKVVASHAMVVGPARTAARWAAGGALAALIAVIAFVYGRGAQEQHVTDEIQSLHRQVERLEKQLDDALRNQPKDPRP